MKKGYILFYVAVILVSLLSVFFINNSFISENQSIDDGYRIVGYHNIIEVNSDNTISVEENITVVYNSNRHGIYRYLPTVNRVTYMKDGKKVRKNYKISYENDNIEATNYADSYYDGDFYVIQIGDPYSFAEKFVNHHYQIKYTMVLGDDRDKDFDFFYFNVIGSGWNTTISNVSFNITFNKKINNEKMQLYIADKPEQILNLENNGTSISYVYNGTLNPFEAITVRTEMQEGYFKVDNISSKSLGYDIALLIIVCLILGIVFIIKKSNSNQKDLISVVEFDKPEDLNSAEVGYLIDGDISDKDIVSLIVYWANNGYLSIKEENRKFYLTKLKDYENRLDENYNHYEKKFFDRIFAKSTENVEIDHIGSECYSEIQHAVLTIKAKHDSEMFSQKAKSGRNISAVLISVVAFLVSTFINSYILLYNGFIFNVAFSVLIYFSLKTLIYLKDNQYTLNFEKRRLKYIVWFIMSVILISFYTISCFDLFVDLLGVKIFVVIAYYVVAYLIYTTNIRTIKGIDKLGRLVGLREYIETAEKGELELLVKENPSAYYDILPYAYVLGVSDVWIKKFEDIKIVNPTWLYTDMDNYLFTNYYFSRILVASLNSTQRNIGAYRTSKNIEKAFNTSNGGSSSGSGFGGGSGFSGGGFSGGGFGGGGGGSW